MVLLKVDPEGLRTLAATCRSLGVEIAGGSVHPAVAFSGQATAKAVSAAHGAADRAAQAMAARMRDTALALEAAGSRYALDEADAAAALDGLLGGT